MAGKEATLSLVVRAVDKATAPLRAITARLNASLAPLKKWNESLDGFRKALDPLRPIGGALMKVGGAARAVGSEVFSLGARLVGLAAGAGLAFFAIIHGAVEAGDKLAELSDRAGLNVDTFASLQFAAAQADVDQETFNASIDKFVKNLGAMKAGGGEFIKFLEKVSPKLAQQVKGSKSTEEALALMTDAFAKVKDPAKRAILATETFGKSGLQMAAFLGQGSAAIQEQQRRFLELHGSSEAFAHGAGDLDNAMRESQVAFLGLRDAAAGALFPALTKLAKVVTDFVVKNRDGLRLWAERAGAAIEKWLAGGGFERLVDSLSRIADAVSSVVKFLGPMGTAIAALTVLALPLISALGSLSVAMVELGIAAAPLALAMAPFILAAGAVALLGKTIYDNWGDIKDLFKNLGETITTTLLNWREFKKELAVPLTIATGGVGLDTIESLNPLSSIFSFGSQLKSSLGVANAPPVAARSTNDAHVTVAFQNAPRGVTVNADPASTAPMSLDVGYSMAESQ